MSEGILVPLADALPIAARYVQMLKPVCSRVEVAGSIRRKRPHVGDIEIVCIPKTENRGLFADHTVHCVEFRSVVTGIGTVIKGSSLERYTQRKLKEGMTLDLFMARPENWGFIFAIRTGSAKFSHEVLGKGWKKAGYYGDNGMLRNTVTGAFMPVPEEEDLFKLIGYDWIPPEEREL